MAVCCTLLPAFAAYAQNSEPRLVNYTTSPILIDGIANESAWEKSTFFALDNLLLGNEIPSSNDFAGRYKLLWDRNYLYLLVEVVDDHMSDRYADPLVQYWDEDCVEVFIDEDASGGPHTYNHNAFAYHVAIDNQVVDIDTDKQPKLFNDHIESQWKRSSSSTVWELAIQLFDDSFEYNGNNQPIKLNKGKSVGFMLAYCDADGQGTREHFMGSEPLKGEQRNMGYQDASVFGRIVLVEN